MPDQSLHQLLTAISDGTGLTYARDAALVDDLAAQYPFLSLPAAMMLRNDPDIPAEYAESLKARIALNAPDMDSLMRLIDPSGAGFASFYPASPEPETPSTDKAIDTFLDNYAQPGAADLHEQQLLERLIFNPVPADYAQTLVDENETADNDAPLSEQDAMLEAFLASQDNATGHSSPEPAMTDLTTTHVKTAPDAPLSESLAKIYIRQKRFDKAYEIISRLSLNFPKKSIYFADQLRFLQKLMYLQSHSQEAKKHQ